MPKKAPVVPTPLVNKDGSVTLYLVVVHATPDGVTYKPYSTQFAPTVPVYVPVTIPKVHVLSTTPLIVSPQGWFLAARFMATASAIAAGA